MIVSVLVLNDPSDQQSGLSADDFYEYSALARLSMEPVDEWSGESCVVHEPEWPRPPEHRLRHSAHLTIPKVP